VEQTRRAWRVWWLVASLVCVGMPVAAQQLPDAAQEVLRQEGRERELRARQERGRDVRLERAGSSRAVRLPEAETPCFPIERIELDGEEARRFRWALKAADVRGDPAHGRCLGTQGVNLVLARVQDAIIARGYVTTRVLVPPQDLTAGVLRLTLVPGRIRTVRFDREPARASWRGALPARPGDVLQLRHAEQALENLQRVPTVSANIQFVPADEADAAPGESDLLIGWQQRARWRGQAWLDDGGSTATGRWQGGVTAALDNALGWNDLSYVNFGRSFLNGSGRGTRSWSAHSSVPFGYWLVAGNLSRYDYQQTVAGAFESYRYSGSSRHGELRLSRLLWRSARSKTSAHVRGWRRASDNFVDDVEILVQRRRMGGWEAGLSQRRFWGRATLDLGLAYRRGTGAFGAQHAPEEVFAEGTSRSRRILADAQVAVPFQLGQRWWRYTSSWRGQWNRTPLVAQDRFAIGGRYSVRGFDGDVMLTGERGWLVRNDLGLPFGRRYEAYLGADYGHVGGASQPFQRGHDLSGMALGVRGCSARMQWEVFAGQPLSRPAGFPGGAVFGFSLSHAC